MIDSLCDEDLPGFLCQYVTQILDDHGCNKANGPPQGDVLAKLPRPIRAAYTLVVLDSEVKNGGFYQLFTNSSGQIIDQILEDLRLIGAGKHCALLETAIDFNQRLENKYVHYKNRFKGFHPNVDQASMSAFWSDVESEFEPELDRLASDYYALEIRESLWDTIAKFVRDHSKNCVHNRNDP